MRRRKFLLSGVALAAVGAALPAPLLAQRAPRQHTFVLVHGAWHGGWCWSRVADILRAHGHRVFTPTQTGLGERSHLLSKDITLDTFVTDIANVLNWERLEDVVLVGHSFGGTVISGVADRERARIRQLIYLDALLLEDGQSPFSQLPKDVVDARVKAAMASSNGLSLPVPPPDAFGVVTADDKAFVADRLTPHPLGTYQSPLRLKSPVGNGLPATYIVCTDPIYGPLKATREWVAAQRWPTEEIRTGHDAMVSAPTELAALLERLAA